MNQLIVFLYESGISIAILYLFYWLLLRKETYFSLNRIILIISMALAIILPFIKISFNVRPDSGTIVYIIDQYLIADFPITPENTLANAEHTISHLKILHFIYFLGVLLFSIKFLVQLFQVLGLIKKYGISKFSGYKIVPIKQDISPFSFFNLIFINTHAINNDELKNILHHEWIHIKKLHTVDIVVFEIICVLQWFNPFVWLYKYAIKEVHEYEADRGVINKGENSINYQKLILNQVLGNQFYRGVHNLINHSLIKNRIAMITKTQSKSRTIVKSLLIIPIAAILVITFSFTKGLNQTENSESTVTNLKTSLNEVELVDRTVSKINDFSNDETFQKNKQQDSSEVFFIVEEMPSFLGNGVDGFRTWVGQNLHYPKEARDNQIEGKVFVQLVIETAGNVSNVKIVRGADPLLDNEALRVVNSSPNWTPGKQKGKPVRVSLTFPINFVLDSRKEMIDNSVTLSTEDETQVFFIVEEMPSFLGEGMDGFRTWIGNNLHYPKKAKDLKIEGKVFVRLIIEENGNVSNVELVRGVDPLIDAEALRVVKSSPNWTPGKQKGKAVKVSLTFPIEFKLDKQLKGINSDIEETQYSKYYSLGVIQFNKGVQEYVKVNKIIDNAEFAVAKKKADKTFGEAIPMFEKALEIAEDNKQRLDAMMNLKTIYRRLQMMDKYEDMQKQIDALGV